VQLVLNIAVNTCTETAFDKTTKADSNRQDVLWSRLLTMPFTALSTSRGSTTAA
jgi:hypothetical protein